MESNINEVFKYIEEHLEEQLTTLKLSQIAGYSECHFIRMFKANMNVTVTEYVIKRRLIKASEDILSGEKIIDVAFRYGWQSHSGFTKAFVKEFDFAPSLLKTVKVSIEILGGSGMSHVFLGSTNIGETKEKLFELLQCKLKENGIEVNEEILQATYKIACEAYKGANRYSGEEYITHLLNVAIILAELGAEENVIYAGMFCDVRKKGVISIESLQSKLYKNIYDIVWQVNNTENLSKSTDEVIIIKLAERLHNMRTVEFMDEAKRREKAKETIDLYMPLARKLNNQKLIDELNDLGMKYV